MNNVPYPKYRSSSGEDWLGWVPTHWDLVPVGYYLRLRSGDYLSNAEVSVEPEDGGAIPVIGGNGVSGYTARANVDSDTIVIGRVGALCGNLHYLRQPSWVTDNALIVSEVRSFDLRYLTFALRALDLNKWANQNAQPLITGTLVKARVIPRPPVDEQSAIADFLDRETAQIDALIKDQQRLIELLNEEVTSLVLSSIDSAETRELRLENVARTVSRPVIQKVGELYTPIGLFNRGRGLFHKESREMDDMGDSDFFWIEKGDLIISGQFAWEGAVALAGEEDTGCVVSHRYPVLRGRPETALTEYLLALLSTKHGDFLLNENSRGAAGRNRPLNITSLLKEKIPVPRMQTQQMVAKAVHRKNRLFREATKQVDLLEEYRSALISAAVTGQIDVRSYKPREAAASCMNS